MRKKKAPKEVEIKLLPPNPNIKKWIIATADLSLTRTGVSVSRMELDTTGQQVESPAFFFIGSIKPEDSTEPVWIRSKAVSLCLKKEIEKAYQASVIKEPELGLIIALEQPPPANDWLSSINRVLHAVLLDPDIKFSTVHILSINASSLRSAFGLVKRGAKNKVENIAKAYEYLDREGWPELDTDSCDAALLAVIAQHVASMLLGHPENIPDKFKRLLCDNSQFMKGEGRNSKILTKGILWRPTYWAQYTPHNVSLKIKDASIKTKKLKQEHTLL